MKTLSQANSEKKLQDFMDSHFLIGNRYVLKDGSVYIDPGDALQRTGYMAISDYVIHGQPAISAFKIRLESHRIDWGLYVRHRFSDTWARSLNVTTGDQLRPVIIAMGFYKMRREVLEIALRLILRGGFYWNTRDTGETNMDKKKMPGWSGPEHWATIIRALGPAACVALLPLLLLGDLVGLFATINATFFYPYEKIKNCDQLNRIAMLTQGVAVFPTPLSKLSHYIFKKFRPIYRVWCEDHTTITHTYRVRYWQDILDRSEKNVVDYINESYFWAPQDPPLHRFWYAVSKKYWE